MNCGPHSKKYDAAVLERIKKAGTISADKKAIQMLRAQGVGSMSTLLILIFNAIHQL